MRVIHICNVPLPPNHPDYGKIFLHPGRWVANLALAQKEHTEIKPFLITIVPGASSDFEMEIKGIQVIFLKMPCRFRSASLFFFEKKKIAQALLDLQPDFVHAHGTEESYALAAQTSRKPYVITLQGVIAIINSIIPPPIISRARVQQFTEWLALSRAKDVITKSEYIAKETAKHFPHLRMHHIPNTIDPCFVGVPNKPRIPGSIAFVGLISQRKGLDLLVEAFKDYQRTTKRYDECVDKKLLAISSFHILGNNPNKPSDYEKNVVEKLKCFLGKKLVLHGIVSESYIVDILSTCEILVAPSLEEMFGNQVIEALLLGVWPVVSSGTAMAENVERFGAGTIFEKGNYVALQKGIIEAQRQLFSWDREKTLQKIIEYMGPETVAKKHCDLYKKLLLN